MNLPRIINPGVYRHAQNGHQIIYHPWISLGVRGLLRRDEYDPQGNLLASFDSRNEPYIPRLAIGMPGFRMDFTYDSTRENWVIMMDWDALRYDVSEQRLLIRYDDTELEIPRRIFLTPTELETFREQFRTITEYHNSALPQNQLTASIMMQNLFLRFLQEPVGKDDLVEQFRKRLDADEKWEKTILEHCREQGIGRDRIREQFFARYKLSPGDYRMRKRLQKILNLFAYSDLSLKEIAFAVGMKNATHLNSLLKKEYGRTPKELCREYRFRQSV